MAARTAQLPHLPIRTPLPGTTHHSPTLSLRSFDIITDRHSLRELLVFLGSDAAEFQINAEVVANTLLLLAAQGRGWGPANEGYGKSLERRFTRRQECSRESVTHCRAVEYTPGGLRMLVRFEVDACIAEEEAAGEKEEAAAGEKEEAAAGEEGEGSDYGDGYGGGLPCDILVCAPILLLQRGVPTDG
ncbi:hypothetical protein BZA05DRAFT_96313 [Tricharina praecox]|uniref:uncharacterized protein n=1 Tax=Tricharina praecox TaxID=43433 RepID=UPI0022204CCE|nr:uncharacterized protein BZA05DRAFT_96313 [Tricharina praecox]KAI5848387.1 hypothetical protein BZA05DRAFT_96313 [Tricharina praecox]